MSSSVVELEVSVEETESYQELLLRAFKNSLGLCKHILVVLEHLHARPRVLQQAVNEQEWADPPGRASLSWDPIRPLTGLGDWLERVVWTGDAESAAARSRRAAQAMRW